MSAPVVEAHRRLIAIVSVWGPRDRMPPARFGDIGTPVRGAAEEIGTALAVIPGSPPGAPPPTV